MISVTNNVIINLDFSERVDDGSFKSTFAPNDQSITMITVYTITNR